MPSAFGFNPINSFQTEFTPSATTSQLLSGGGGFQNNPLSILANFGSGLARQQQEKEAATARAQNKDLEIPKDDKLFKSVESGGEGLVLDVFRDRQGNEVFRSAPRPASKGLSVNIDTNKLDKKNVSDVNKVRLLGRKQLFALKNIKDKLDAVPDELFTTLGRLESEGRSLLQKIAGIETRDEKSKKQRDNFVQFLQASGRFFDDYRTAVTGAQASFREIQFLLSRVPIANGLFTFDSRIDFKAKMAFLESFIKANDKRLEKIQSEGFTIISKQGDDDFTGERDGVIVDLSQEFPIEQFIEDEFKRKKDSAQSSVSITAQGRTFTFPDKAAADKFKSLAGIK